MNSNTSKGGIATPESLPPITQLPRKDDMPTPASYPTYQSPYLSAQRRAPRDAHLAGWIVGGTVALLVLAALVVTLLVGLVGGVALSTIGQREVSATTTQTFLSSGTPTLVISDAAGNVTMQRGSGNLVMVQVAKHAWGVTDGVAKAALHSTVVDVTRSGNTITVNTQFGSGLGRRSVDLTVTVPAETNADVQVAAGNIDARQVIGAIRLDTGAGNVAADAVTFAGTSRLHTGAGNVTIDGAMASGAAVDVLVGAGNATLTLPFNTPAHLTASTGVGNLTITGWQIPVTGFGITGHTASGDLGGNPTGALTIQVGSGNLTLTSR